MKKFWVTQWKHRFKIIKKLCKSVKYASYALNGRNIIREKGKRHITITVLQILGMYLNIEIEWITNDKTWK